MRHQLDSLFNPASAAVIGASTVLHKIGGRRWRSMVEANFDGPLYPIHPTASEILGRKAYPSLRDVPGPVEMAVVLVRPDLVPGVIDDCVAAGVRVVVVITAGFGETGDEGKRAERGLVDVARAHGARLVGPNCAGLFSASGHVNALGWSPPRGPIAVISQSGNMALTFAQLAREKGLGFSKLVTIGNAADIRVPEYLDYLFADPDTKVIVAYLEGFGPLEGRALFDCVRAHPSPKPVIVLKPGETESGRRAVLSHTRGARRRTPDRRRGLQAVRHPPRRRERRGLGHGHRPRVSAAAPGGNGGRDLGRRRPRDHRLRHGGSIWPDRPDARPGHPATAA